MALDRNKLQSPRAPCPPSTSTHCRWWVRRTPRCPLLNSSAGAFAHPTATNKCRTRRISLRQRHQLRHVLFLGRDQIDQALFAKSLDRCREGRVRHRLVAIQLGRVVVEDGLVLLHLGGAPAGG